MKTKQTIDELNEVLAAMEYPGYINDCLVDASISPVAIEMAKEKAEELLVPMWGLFTILSIYNSIIFLVLVFPCVSVSTCYICAGCCSIFGHRPR